MPALCGTSSGKPIPVTACLQAYGALPVLYASQWFLTAFSCPFSAAFSARVIDVMLTENCPDIMLRTALVVLAECQEDLLQLADFEDIITFLKVRSGTGGHSSGQGCSLCPDALQASAA